MNNVPPLQLTYGWSEMAYDPRPAAVSRWRVVRGGIWPTLCCYKSLTGGQRWYITHAQQLQIIYGWSEVVYDPRPAAVAHLRVVWGGLWPTCCAINWVHKVCVLNDWNFRTLSSTDNVIMNIIIVRLWKARHWLKQGLFRLAEKESSIQYGYRKRGTRARVFLGTPITKNEIYRYKWRI